MFANKEQYSHVLYEYSQKIKDIFKPRAYSIYLASDYTTIISNGDLLVHKPSVIDKKINGFVGDIALLHNGNIIHPIKQGVIFDFEAALRMLREFTRRHPFTRITSVRVAAPVHLLAYDYRTMYELFEYFCGSSKVLTIPSAFAAYYELKSSYKTIEKILLIDISSDVTYLSILSAHRIFVCSEMRFGWDNLQKEEDDEWYESMALRVSYFLSQSGQSFEKAFLICNDSSKTDKLVSLTTYLPIDVIIPQDFHLVICRGIEKAQDENSNMFHPLLHNNEYRFVRTLNVPIYDRDLQLFKKNVIKDKYESNFKPYSLKKPTKVIAVSCGAINALEAFCKEGKNKCYDNVDFVAITDTYRDKPDFQEDNLHKLVFDAEEMLRYRNMGDNTLLYYALDNIVGENTRHVIFVHTFGSTPPDAYMQYLKEKGISITLLATKPYQFEGTIKRERVEKQLMQSKKHTDHLVIIDAEEVRKAHPDITFFDAFSLLDKVIGKNIETILNDNTETIRAKRLTRQFPEGVIRLNCNNYKKYLPLDIVVVAYAWDNIQIAILTSDSQLYYIDLETGFTLDEFDKIIPQKEQENMELISTQPGIDLYISNRHKDILDETIHEVCKYKEHNLLVNLLLNIFKCRY